MNMDEIRRDLGFLAGHEVVVHGSRVTGDDHERSDIDIAIITRNPDPDENAATFMKFLGLAPPMYDVSIFESLPLEMKISVANHHRVIFGDEVELSEYFYHFRKIWKDCKHRVEQNRHSSMQEKRQALRSAPASHRPASR